MLAKNKNTTTERESTRTLSSNGNSGLASESESSDEESDSAATPQIKREPNAPSGSSSNGSTSSSTSDDESDEDSEPEVEVKRAPDDGSSSSSSEESSADEIVIEKKTIVELKAPSSNLGNDSKRKTNQNRNAASSSSGSSSSSSESDSESVENAKESAAAAAEKGSTLTPPRPKNSTPTAKNILGTSKSGSGTRFNTAPPPAKGKKDKEASGTPQNRPETSTANTVTSSAKDTTIHENDETRVTKKRRMDVDGDSVVTAVAAPLKPQKKRRTRKDRPLVEGDPEAADAVTIEHVEVATPHGIVIQPVTVPLFTDEPVLGAKNDPATAPLSSGKNNKGSKAPRMANNRFMRVDPTKVQHAMAMDNSYVSKVRHSLPL